MKCIFGGQSNCVHRYDLRFSTIHITVWPIYQCTAHTIAHHNVPHCHTSKRSEKAWTTREFGMVVGRGSLVVGRSSNATHGPGYISLLSANRRSPPSAEGESGRFSVHVCTV